MYGCGWRAGLAAIAISLCAVPAGAVDTSRMVQFVQNVTDTDPRAAEPSQPPVADASELPANSPEQIRKAQTELRRLDCLRGRIDGKLGDQTRQAVKKFRASAGQPVVEVNITEDLISDLAERGAGFCRPARKFFAVGVRPSGNPALLPPHARGARTGPVPATATRPPFPAARH